MGDSWESALFLAPAAQDLLLVAAECLDLAKGCADPVVMVGQSRAIERWSRTLGGGFPVGRTRTAWLWSFIGRDEVDRELAHVLASSRFGETPVKVRGETEGKLVADACSGYNNVATPGHRERAGCRTRVAHRD